MRRADTITLPRSRYQAMVDRIEDLEDALDMSRIEKRRDDRDYLPAALVKRLTRGEHPLRVWRECRGLAMEALAEQSGIGQSYLSEIEMGKKPGSVSVLQALAKALRVSIDDIVP